MEVRIVGIDLEGLPEMLLRGGPLVALDVTLRKLLMRLPEMEPRQLHRVPSSNS
jgi:hypothetical protein